MTKATAVVYVDTHSKAIELMKLCIKNMGADVSHVELAAIQAPPSHNEDYPGRRKNWVVALGYSSQEALDRAQAMTVKANR